jgi:hypothetical protein
MTREVMQQCPDHLDGKHVWDELGQCYGATCEALAQPEEKIVLAQNVIGCFHATEDHSLLAQMLYEQTPTYQMGLNDRVLWRDATPEARRKWIDKAALAQPTSGDYALGYAEGFNDACKPKAQPARPLKDAALQSWELHLAQAAEIRELLDIHAPETEGNLQTRLAQVFAQPAQDIDYWYFRYHETLNKLNSVLAQPEHDAEAHLQAVSDFGQLQEREWLAKAKVAQPEQLQWTDAEGVQYTFPLEGATQLLADLYAEWPGGLAEIESAMRTLAQPVQPAANTTAANKPFLIYVRPSKVPERKGPYPTKALLESGLRELQAAHPDAISMVIDMPDDCYPTSGVEWIDLYGDKRRGRLAATSPPQRQPLTHEQRLDLLTAFKPSKSRWNAESILIDMVEAAHNIKEIK